MASAAKTFAIGVFGAQHDVSLSCTTSLLRLQQAAVQRFENDPWSLQVFFAEDLNEVFNKALEMNAHAVAAVHTSVAFQPQFILDALASPHPCVVGGHPLAHIDWTRVKDAATKLTPTPESLQRAGLTYNVQIVNDTVLDRYLPVKAVHSIDIIVLRTSVLRCIADRHFSDISYEEGDKFLFMAEDVLDGAKRSAGQRFLDFLAEESVQMVVDTEHQCGKTGVAEFTGCPGLRGRQLR